MLRSMFKGWVGEGAVNVGVGLFLDKETYRRVKNVTLPTEDGGTTQLDHVVVSRYGIFVVETKNMSGWIFGREKDQDWTQKIHANHTQKFQNPLRQNYKHTKTLAALLELPHDRIESVVVFIGAAAFKTKMPDNVVHGAGLIRYIKSKKAQLFDDDQVAEFVDRINELRLKRGWNTRGEHIGNVNRIRAEKEAVENRIAGSDSPQLDCPKCGSPMRLRTAKRGERAGSRFWGCSRYPKCRAIVDIR